MIKMYNFHLNKFEKGVQQIGISYKHLCFFPKKNMRMSHIFEHPDRVKNCGAFFVKKNQTCFETDFFSVLESDELLDAVLPNLSTFEFRRVCTSMLEQKSA